MVDWTAGRNTWSAKAMVTSLRAFLRFAHATGRTGVPLAGAVPAVASWRRSSLPRGLKAAEIERLLAGCERDTAAGLRDYAVLSLLARLGLRGAEAAGLQLGDIDWRAGEIAVTGKGSKTERLPLPALAGEALAAWLKDGRPECESRSVFVTVRRPFRPLTPESVRAVMARACERAGMERRGTHRFRHALATEMLRAGASLPEVGQVLRHRSDAVDHYLCQGRPERAAPAGPPVARERGMSGLRARAEEYLAMRRALGFKLDSWGPRLMSFVGFCEARGATTVTTDLAVEWATTTSRGSDHEAYQARRLDVVADLRPAPAAAGPGHRGPARGRAGPPPVPGPALPLLPAGGHRPDGRGQDAAARVSGRDLADADWPAGRDRHAPGRGLPAAHGRRRPERGDDHDRGLQVRQVPHGVPPPDRGSRPARL